MDPAEATNLPSGGPPVAVSPSTDAGCCSDLDIERVANGEVPPLSFSSHMDLCVSCRSRLDSARRDADFIGRVRVLAAPDLGPAGAPRIPGYRTLDIISRGAQGIIYRAVQEATLRTVAIKVLLSGGMGSSRQRARAQREAEIAARVRHPNIVTVFESRTLSDGAIAMVMEYIDGVPLDAWAPPGNTPRERQRRLLRVMVDICNGIHHSHLNGVIHRDLKPDNIIVTPDGRPVIVDFGIASAGGIRTTMTGEFAGTPAYASPEQVSGKPDQVNALTDIYSLGVILYNLVCARMPYKLDGSILDIARTILETDPTPPRQVDPSVSHDLEAIILRATRKDKDHRYQSAAAFGHDLEQYLNGEPVDARSGSGWYLLRKAVSLNRKRLTVLGTGVVLVCGCGAAVIFSLSKASESASAARFQREQAKAENARARAVTELLREALPSTDPSRPDLINIVGSGLSRLYFRLESGAFAGDPAVDQSLRRLWGHVYTGFGGKAAGHIAYAEVSLRNGLVRLRVEQGAQSPEIAATLHELAGVLFMRHRASEAEECCRNSLDMRTRLLGAADITVAESRALLARILMSRGARDDAGREADSVLAALRAFPKNDVDLLAGSMNALKARVAIDTGALGEAEPLAREALTRCLRQLPPEDPDLIASLGDAADLSEAAPNSPLAILLSQCWDCERSAVARAIRRDLPVLSAPDDSDISRIAHTGRTVAIHRLVRLQESLLDPNDPAIVSTLFAEMRSAGGEGLLDIRAAATLRASDLLSQRFGPNDFSVLLCTEEASAILAVDGNAARAVTLGRRAVAIWDAVPPAARDRLLAADCRRRLAWFLSLDGQYADSASEYSRAIDELSVAVGPEHHTVALAEAGLAFAVGELGDHSRAEKLSAHATELAERLSATAPDQVAHICFYRAHILARAQRHAEAEHLFQRAWDRYYRYLGPKYRLRTMCVTEAAAACDALGDAAASARWRELDKSESTAEFQK